MALGPLTRSTDMLSGLLIQGDLHSLRVSETQGQLEAELAAEAVDVIVCEVSGDASEHLNLPVRLLRLYALNRLAKVPAVIWLSDLPAQTLDAQASELRDAGVGVEVASLVDKHSLAGALGRLATRRPARPAGAACPPARFTEDKLRQSVESGQEFRIVLQPQYDLTTGRSPCWIRRRSSRNWPGWAWNPSWARRRKSSFSSPPSTRSTRARAISRPKPAAPDGRPPLGRAVRIMP
jgi:hypothetical protein